MSNVRDTTSTSYFFSEQGSMNIADLFGQMSWQNPKKYNMSGAQLAALLTFTCRGNGMETAQLLFTLSMLESDACKDARIKLLMFTLHITH